MNRIWPQWTHTERLESWVFSSNLWWPDHYGARIGPSEYSIAGPKWNGRSTRHSQCHWLVHSQSFSDLRQSNMLMPIGNGPTAVGLNVTGRVGILAFLRILGWRAGSRISVGLIHSTRGGQRMLARGWWGHAGAAASPVSLCDQPLIRELVNGRPTQVFGAFFSLCAWAMRCAPLHISPKKMRHAGIFWGLGAISYWYYGAFCSQFGLYFGLFCVVKIIASAHPRRLAFRAGGRRSSALRVCLHGGRKDSGQGSME